MFFCGVRVIQGYPRLLLHAGDNYVMILPEAHIQPPLNFFRAT